MIQVLCAFNVVITVALSAFLVKGNYELGFSDYLDYLNLLFNYNMPLRAIAKMTGGIVSMGMVDGLVMELKGFWIIGILRVIVEAVKNQMANKAMEKRLSEGGRKS